MAKSNSKQETPVVKPFLRGTVTDERTVKTALGFFGILIVVAFMCFLVCSMLSMDNAALRIALNCAVEAVILLVFFNNASGRGAEDVARGEILYQRQEKGLTFAESERKICFHPLKAFANGLLGTLPLFILALILALTADRQSTGAGGLPGWLSIYERRTEVGDALVAYTVSTGMSFIDVVRLLVRIAVMPFVSMAGAENRDTMLLVERLSPLLVLLPSIAYGIGYLQGVQMRTKVHTEIASNDRRRIRREKKARKARRSAASKGPEQLN